MQWGNLFDHVHLRILSGNCLCKKTYEQIILFKACKFLEWYTEGRYEQKERTDLGIEVGIRYFT